MTPLIDRATKIARDLSVIIVGILLALAADAAWEERQERALESNYLTAIRADLSIIRDEVVRAISVDSAGEVLNRDAARLLRSDTASVPPRVSFFFENVFLPTGTIRAMVSTGDIRLVASPELRSRIVNFDTLLEASLEWSRSLEAQIIANVRDNLRAREVALRGDSEEAQPSADLRSAEFIATVVAHQLILSNRVRLHRRILAAADELDAAIASGLRTTSN